jgi:hypothetical protein
MTPVFEQLKTVCASDHMTIGTGALLRYPHSSQLFFQAAERGLHCMHAKYVPTDSNNFLQQHTTDTVLPGVPTLEDLGVTLTKMEDQVPWELKPWRAGAYYDEELGEFEKPPPPKEALV